MGYKIFVSYKYKDNSVYPLSSYRSGFPFPYGNPTTVRDYVDKLEAYFDHTNNIYKGESDNEDLSNYSDDAIWEKLKDRIFDSSVTIVMVSPNMRESHRSERSQWIPWEISYSLRETTRGDRTSHSNAILAVVLPDYLHQYNYFTDPHSYQRLDGQDNNEDPVFPIIRKNMGNNRWDRPSAFSRMGFYSISIDDSSYIPSVKWDDFIRHPMAYIECAVKRKENFFRYNICTDVEFFRWNSPLSRLF